MKKLSLLFVFLVVGFGSLLAQNTIEFTNNSGTIQVASNPPGYM